MPPQIIMFSPTVGRQNFAMVKQPILDAKRRRAIGVNILLYMDSGRSTHREDIQPVAPLRHLIRLFQQLLVTTIWLNTGQMFNTQRAIRSTTLFGNMSGLNMVLAPHLNKTSTSLQDWISLRNLEPLQFSLVPSAEQYLLRHYEMLSVVRHMYHFNAPAANFWMVHTPAGQWSMVCQTCKFNAQLMYRKRTPVPPLLSLWPRSKLIIEPSRFLVEGLFFKRIIMCIGFLPLINLRILLTKLMVQ